MAALDLVERHPVRLTSFLENHGAVDHAGDPSRECGLLFHRLRRDDLRQPPCEAPVVPLVAKRPVEARRGHLRRVLLAECLLPELVLDVEDRAQVLADALTVLDPDTVLEGFDAPRGGSIDDDAEHHTDGLAPELHVEDVEPMAPRHPHRGVAQPAQIFSSWRTW